MGPESKRPRVSRTRGLAAAGLAFRRAAAPGSGSPRTSARWCRCRACRASWRGFWGPARLPSIGRSPLSAEGRTSLRKWWAMAPTVGYQGEPGAYSEDAARHLFPNAELEPRRTLHQVFGEVASGALDAGVVPVE